MHDIVEHASPATRRTDYLFRISLKCIIRNDEGKVLVVKETGRDWWDLPGGGIDHGETLQVAIAREMKEEVNLEGNFTFKIVAVEEPKLLEDHDFWQLRLIFAVKPSSMIFSAGEDGDKVACIDPERFRESSSKVEQCIYRYNKLLDE